ncbi:MAG: ATP-binding cassette domain-containing protein [Lachnospiraceae bacterium]|nr:ATP-binding cassette domain-containing protein [Lachnospiraceae bacterium]
MIQLENVNKKIKGKMVLQDINLTLENGKTYGLRGINGSGKTMLMRMIAGLIYPDSGRVLVDGKCLGRDISFPEHMGLLIENPVFLDSYTGMQNLRLLAELNGKAEESAIRNVLEQVGLDPDDRRKYRKYSLGMKQRLGIASAVMEEPQILILDEPLNALDKDGIELFEKILFERKRKNCLIVLACHDEQKLLKYADRIIEVENGRCSEPVNVSE